VLTSRHSPFHERALLPVVLLTASTTYLSAQARGPAPANRLRDSLTVARVACQVAQSVRSPLTHTHCFIERFRETPHEFVVRVRELPDAPRNTLAFPRSEVRLRKDRGEAVLTRVPEL
jgi:hypothetical protein